jgi:hypothetical protein
VYFVYCVSFDRCVILYDVCYFCMMCVICVLCLIVVPLPPFAVKYKYIETSRIRLYCTPRQNRTVKSQSHVKTGRQPVGLSWCLWTPAPTPDTIYKPNTT